MPSTTPHPAAHGPSSPHAEDDRNDVNVGAVLGFAAGLIVTAVFVYFMIWLLFLFLADRTNARSAPQFPLAAGQDTRLPPEPRLQTNPRQDLRDLRQSEDAALNGYGWVDRNTGTVHIPIGEAMRLTVERGLPTRRGENK